MTEERNESRLYSYRELIVWKKAFELAKEIYRLTDKFPQKEMYGMTSQLRRAAVSIVSNIAEGFSRKSEKEKIQFASVAFGSSAETETQLLLAKEVNLAAAKEFKKSEELVLEVRRILNSYLLKQERKGVS